MEDEQVMSALPALSDATFASATAKGNWIVDFWAEWCGPCKIIGPEVEAAAQKLKGNVRVAQVNVDENQDVAQQHDIMSIPTLLFIKNGEVVDRTVGVLEADDIIAKANEVF